MTVMKFRENATTFYIRRPYAESVISCVNRIEREMCVKESVHIFLNVIY
jgi:hypothetical protein